MSVRLPQLDAVRNALMIWHETFGERPVSLKDACARAAENPTLAVALGGLVPRGLVNPRGIGGVVRWLRGLPLGGYAFSEGTRSRGYRRFLVTRTAGAAPLAHPTTPFPAKPESLGPVQAKSTPLPPCRTELDPELAAMVAASKPYTFATLRRGRRPW
jgi:hypothetical protein